MWALRRAQARSVMRLYDAAKPNQQRTAIPTGNHSPDAIVDHGRDKLRRWARHFDENYDLVTGMFNAASIVISRFQIEPMIRLQGGELHEVANDRLMQLWTEWSKECDITGTYSWHTFAKLAARSYLRDGEIFVHHLMGVDTPSGVPYRLEALEADFLSLDNTKPGPPPIIHGVEKGPSGQVLAYHFAQEHPGDTIQPGFSDFINNTIRIPGERVSHLKHTTRFHQTRGVTILHPVINRLDNLQNYESYEQTAARVAASMCAILTRDPVFGTETVNSETGALPFEMQPGQIWDVGPGSRVETIDTKRPSEQMMPYRDGMVKMFSAGTGTRYSLNARDYDGSYSSQRQELTEGSMFDDDYHGTFLNQLVNTVWKNFATAAFAANLVRAPGANPDTLFDMACSRVSIPWIDIEKEAKANETRLNTGQASRSQVLREKGLIPEKVHRERLKDATKQNEIDRIEALVPPAPQFSQISFEPEVEDGSTNTP